MFLLYLKYMLGKLSGILSLILILIFMQHGNPSAGRLEKATFAGGCFWCMEPPFEKLEGVKEVISGYTGGHKADPTYEEVSSGSTGQPKGVAFSNFNLISKRFARALVVSTLEGRTAFTESFRLLGLKKMATFHELGHSLGMGF